MSQSQRHIKRGLLSVVASEIANHAEKSAGLRHRAVAQVLAAAIALTLGGSCAAFAKSPALKVLYNFCSLRGCIDGAQPSGGLVPDESGNLYGTTFAGGLDGAGTIFKLADGILTTLHAFANNGIDGGNPYTGLILDKAGNLFGTTYGGGAGNEGIVFKLAPNGAETVLHAFTNNGIDGELPIGLLLERHGALYGTTYAGGATNNGTVFEVASTGAETVLYSFAGGKDGAYPQGALIADGAGNLYGPTNGGGAHNFGTVFKLAPNGTETVLYAFKGGKDGAYPVGPVILDKVGNLYGTTNAGGAGGFGTVFKLAPNGTETLVYTFKGGNDGANPAAGLIADKAGNFYGTTTAGGNNDCSGGGCGTVFKLAPDGAETVLWALVAASDGAEPFFGSLTVAGVDQKDTLFGTAALEGLHGVGTVFRIKK